VSFKRGAPFAAAAALLILVAASRAQGAPRTIRDDRVNWISGVPTLGRGFSIQSNKLQSMCFEKVKETRPSFDFEYEIKEITGKDLDLAETGPFDRVRNSRVGFFLRKHLDEAKAMQKAGGGTFRTLLAQVVVNSYHRSVDETGSDLDPSAKHLLQELHYTSFFQSCGFFYIRSVRTFSVYVALLQFRVSSDTNADNRFIDELQRGLLSFGSESPLQHEALVVLGQQAQSRNLRAFVSSLGLGKGKSLNLVPLSIEQFRETIQNAAKLMEDPEAGVVSELEVAPWIDNPDVASILSDNLKKNKVDGSLSRRAHNLELNTQIIGSLRETHDHLMSRFDLASLCERTLYRSFPSDPRTAAEEHTRYVDPDKTMFENHSQPEDESRYLSLRQFREHFLQVPPQRILDTVSAYMYGTDKAPGADDCINHMEENRLETVDFTSIPSCTRALKAREDNFTFLDDYCLPRAAQVIYKDPSSR
jgi:hypothetical protein